LVNVTDCAALVDPTSCEPNDRLLGDSETVGPADAPVPLKPTL
jgi:hypothetical protein